MLRVLDLFSGIGGFSLGLERAGMLTTGFVEQDAWCQAVLRKHWPGARIHGDIRQFFPDYGAADVVTGGFPCQPFSVAGKQRGKEDDRYLWPEMLRVIQAVRPAWVIGENVAGIIPLALDKVLSDLEGLSYSALAFVVPACAVDAPHRRDRVWIVGHADRDRKPALPVDDEVAGLRGSVADPSSEQRERSGRDSARGRADASVGREALADSDEPGPQGHRGLRQRAGQRTPRARGATEHCRWLVEPDVGRVAHGVPRRVDRLRGLGNAIVPQIAEEIGRAIIKAEGLA